MRIGEEKTIGSQQERQSQTHHFFPYQPFIRSGMPSVGTSIVGRRVRAELEEPGGSNADAESGHAGFLRPSHGGAARIKHLAVDNAA